VEREYRLRRASDIERVRKTGRSWAVGPVVLVAAPGPDPAGHPRSSFITGKKIGGAVERNRARRQMREAVRALRPRIARGWDLVWIARPSITGQEFGRISGAIQECLRRARLLDLTAAHTAPGVRENHETGRPAVDPAVPADS
jgi:ribonuclease P protein component